VPPIPRFDTLASDGVVKLRAFREDDIPAVVEACRDPEVVRWTRVPEPYDETNAREFLAQSERDREDGKVVPTAIADAETDEYLGSIDLRINARDGRGDIGYFVAPAARRRGVAVRAVRLIADYGFEEVGLARIEIVTHVDNSPSRKVAERAGFKREAVLRSYVVTREGGYADGVMFSRVSAERAS
jgi:RimJ/RimL family protein N-acetyltransferase